MTAPEDIHFGIHEREEWQDDQQVTVNAPALLWTSTNTAADCYIVRLYDENDVNVFDCSYSLGDENKDCYYELTWLLDSCLEDYVISTITLTPVKSDNGSVSFDENGCKKPTGITAVFECSCAVTVNQGAAVTVADASPAEWSDEYTMITFAGTFDPFASVDLFCNYVVDEVWGTSEGRWGEGGTVDGEGNLGLTLENEKYQQLMQPVGKPELCVVSNIVVTNETTASGKLTIHPVSVQSCLTAVRLSCLQGSRAFSL